MNLFQKDWLAASPAILFSVQSASANCKALVGTADMCAMADRLANKYNRLSGTLMKPARVHGIWAEDGSLFIAMRDSRDTNLTHEDVARLATDLVCGLSDLRKYWDHGGSISLLHIIGKHEAPDLVIADLSFYPRCK